MMWIVLAFAPGVMLILAVFITYILERASRAWQVREEPVVERVTEALAGLDCGQCGYPSCLAYAHGIVDDRDAIDKCRPGGQEAVEAVAAIMGVAAPRVGAFFAVVHCGAASGQRLGRSDYQGEATCAAADVVGGAQACVYGCLGMGDCERACPYDAIAVIDGLAVVDYDRCTACGKCVEACPRDIISIERFTADRMLVVACNSTDPAATTRKACTVGCIACGVCQRGSDLFIVRGNLSRFDAAACEMTRDEQTLIEISEKCPTGCLPFRGRADT